VKNILQERWKALFSTFCIYSTCYINDFFMNEKEKKLLIKLWKKIQIKRKELKANKNPFISYEINNFDI